jgi:hypothetical protein
MLMGDAYNILSVLSKINDVPQKVTCNGMDIMNEHEKHIIMR